MNLLEDICIILAGTGLYNMYSGMYMRSNEMIQF